MMVRELGTSFAEISKAEKQLGPPAVFLGIFWLLLMLGQRHGASHRLSILVEIRGFRVWDRPLLLDKRRRERMTGVPGTPVMRVGDG